MEKHGIRPEDVVEAIGWASSLERIVAFIGDDLIVAYNASFDSAVLKAACEHNTLAVPPFNYLCALKLSKTHLELDSYTLKDVSGALELPDFEHHHAGADADACAGVVLEIAQRRHAGGSIHNLWSGTQASRIALTVPPRERAVSSPSSSMSRWKTKRPLNELPQPNPEADPTRPLFGHVILFTGDLLAMGREEAQRKVADQGARNANDLTNKTTILVMGSTGASIAKRDKAWGQASKGHPIRVISDSEFMAMLSD